MPFVELILFLASDSLHKTFSRQKTLIDYLSACEGCLDIVQGRQIEDKDRLYFITTWESYDLYSKASSGIPYGSFIASLVPGSRYSSNSEASKPQAQLQRYHFEVDGDPHQALTAPVTEIAMLKSSEPRNLNWGRNVSWSPVLAGPSTSTSNPGWGARDQELCAAIMGAKRGLPLVQGSFPPLRWGEVRDMNVEEEYGIYCMFVGWASIEAHCSAIREKPLVRHVRTIAHTTSVIDARHIIFKSLRLTTSASDTTQNSTDRTGGSRIHSFL